jgi:hypothetical protein
MVSWAEEVEAAGIAPVVETRRAVVADMVPNIGKLVTAQVWRLRLLPGSSLVLGAAVLVAGPGMEMRLGLLEKSGAQC